MSTTRGFPGELRPRLLLVASTTGYQTGMFVEAAKNLGIDLVLATDRCHVLDDPWGDGALAVRFDEPEAAAQSIAGSADVDGVVALGDRAAYVAAVIAQRLRIPYNSPESVAACRNKYLARQRFQAAGLPVPSFFRVLANDDPYPATRLAPYPCVLKPLGLSASRGVIRADSPDQFIDAFRRIRKLLQQPEIARLREEQDEYIQVESFIPGEEFALEGILTRGRLKVLALFDKPDPLDGPFFEETIYVTPSRSSPTTQHAITQAVQTAIQALGLTEGPIHAEMRVNDTGVWMLKVAARPIGGMCARVLAGLPELILRHALREPVSGLNYDRRSTGVLMLPIPREGVYQGAAGVRNAEAVPGIEGVLITAKLGQMLIPLPEGNSYLGFVFARGESPEVVESALRSAHSKLQFEIAAALPLVPAKVGG